MTGLVFLLVPAQYPLPTTPADRISPGLRPPRGRDVALLHHHRPNATHDQTQVLQLHIGESNHCKITIWDEGTLKPGSEWHRMLRSSR
jgi:hypothetical protein